MWLLYERGGGGALKHSATSWARGHSPWSPNQKPEAIKRYFKAGGNGAVMRCMPHVLVESEAASFSDIYQRTDKDGLATHGHPRAIVGSRAFAWALWWVLSRRESLEYGALLEHVIGAVDQWSDLPRPPQDWMDSQAKFAPQWADDWDAAVHETVHYLQIARNNLVHGPLAIDEQALSEIGIYGETRGAGTIAAATAIFLAARYTSQPLQGLLAAAFLRNTDTDTFASMTGSLLGGLAGGDWLEGYWRNVQDAEYVADMASWLAAGKGPEVPSFEWKMRYRTQIYRRLDEVEPKDFIDLPLFEASHISSVEDYETNTATFIRSWDLQTTLGQKIRIKRFDRGKDGKPRWKNLTPRDMQDKTNEPQPTSQHGPRRAGLVRGVSDLKAACRFYEEVVGLTRERSSKSFVSYGWLALELVSDGPEAPQFSLPTLEDLAASRQAIRVYIDRREVAPRQLELIGSGLVVTPIVEASGQRGRLSFRCSDPDGYVVEFQSRETE